MLQVILDVETKQIFEDVGGYFPERLGISFAGACLREGVSGKGEMRGFFERDLSALFDILEQADVIVGFNIIGFDMPALSSYYQGDWQKMPMLDLLVKIKDSAGHRISLDAVAQETLGMGKSGDGLDAIKYFQTQNWVALEKYCLQDVEITRDIFDYGAQKGKVKFRNKWNRLVECPVDFSFTPRKDLGSQMSLL